MIAATYVKFTVFVHIYYDDSAVTLFKNLKHLVYRSDVNIFLSINCQNPNYSRICKVIEKRYPSIIIIKTSNVGKDIGAKLAMLQAYLNLGFKSEFMLFLHDKKSPQLLHGESWQNVLFKIATPELLNQIESIFKKEDVGMIGRKENLYSLKNDSEAGIFSGNKEIIIDEANKYGLNTDKFDFIGGTMFWVRSSIYEEFFHKYSPLMIRATLEKGNVMDDFGPTVTHSWERLLGWIITSSGFKINVI